MRSLPLSLLLAPLAAHAVRIPFQSISRSGLSGAAKSQRMQMLLASNPGTCSDATCGQLSDTLDVVYFSTITVGGQQYQVQLDTGSSDLWVNATLQPQPKATIMEGVVVSNVYGDGSNYTGPVAFADVQFHGYEVKNQSFTYALFSENDNTAILNLTGLIGLSFDSISNNDQAVQQSTGSKTLGQTFLSNVFAQNSSLEPFISFLLSREADLNTTATTSGAFTIAELEKGYEAIQNSKSVPLFEPSIGGQSLLQWTVPVDSISVGGKNLQITSSVEGSTNVIALLDTGTSAMLIPEEVSDSIYNSLPGVQSFSQQGQKTYLIPCSQTPPSLVITIGGQSIPLHPLDTSVIFQTFETPKGDLISLCAGGIIGYSADSNFAGSGFDLLLGDTFLRNAYTMFNFGSSPSSSSNSNNTPAKVKSRQSSSDGPFVKILGITNPDDANNDFQSTRKQQLSLAPEANQQQIQDLLDGVDGYTPVDTPPLNGTGGGNGNGSPGGGNGNGNGNGNGTGAASTIGLDGATTLCAGLVSAFVAAALW